MDEVVDSVTAKEQGKLVRFDVSALDALSAIEQRALLVFDNEFEILHHNFFTEKLFGLHQEQLLQTGLLQLVPEIREIDFEKLPKGFMQLPMVEFNSKINHPRRGKENVLWKLFSTKCEPAEIGIYLLVGLQTEKKLPQPLPEAQPRTKKEQNWFHISQEIMGYAKNKPTTPEESMDIARRYYESIIAVIPLNVWWVDRSGIIMGCNDAVAKAMGLPHRSDSLGLTYHDLARIAHWKEGAAEKFCRDDQEVFATGIAKNNVEEPPLPNPEGGFFYYLTQRVPLYDDEGNVVGVMGISIDISQRKKAEEALQLAKERAEVANQAKSEFLASMSHDLRTPLNAILGLSEILEGTQLNKEQKNYVQGISEAGTSLLRLIEDILNFSKFEAGKVKLNMECFNVKKLLNGVIELISHQIKQKDVKLVASFSQSAPAEVVGDPHCIRRVLINLLGNAVKFTDEGYILVGVEFVEQTDETVTLQFTVEDSGIGIPRDRLDYVFERFNRVDPSYKGKYKGTGLGLTIVRQLVEAMNGQISVNSQVGKGSTFWCTVPFKLPEDQKLISLRQFNQFETRLMVVSEDKAYCESLFKRLRRSDHVQVSGEECLNVLSDSTARSNAIGTILINDDIGQAKALEIAREIRSFPYYNNILLTFLVDADDDSTQENIHKEALGIYFTKPISANDLIHHIEAELQKWQAGQCKKLERVKAVKAKVLLVEDDKLSQTVASAMLEDIGCSVDIVGCGSEAMSKLNNHYDIILMDIGLPDDDGISLTKKIRGLEARSRFTPIVALTAHVTDTERRECLEGGMNGFLKKPIAKNELLLTIADILLSRPNTIDRVIE